MRKRVARFFNDLPIARKLLLTAIIPLVALIFLSITTYKSVQTFSQDEEQLNGLYLTQQIAAQYLRLIVDMETGFRGYVLTKQDRYLRPYRAAREEIVTKGDDLERMVAEEQNQKQKIQSVRSLAHQLIKEKEALIQIVKAGSREGAMTYLEKGRGLEVMIRIRGLMAEFDRLEQQRIATRLAQMKEDQTATLLVILVGGVLTFGLMASALYLIARSIAGPLVDLTKVVGASPAGVLAAVPALERADEIGYLTHVMHEMGVQIRRHLDQVAESEAILRVVNQNLSASESKYRGLVDHAPFGIFTTKGWDVTFSNRYNQVLAGLDPDEEVDPATFRKFIHPEDRDRVLSEFAQAVACNQPYETVFRFLHGDGTTRKVLSRRLPIEGAEGSAAPTYIGFNIDVTALDELRIRLSRSERLATLGQVAAGIAHEIRNPLIGIGSTAALLLEELPASDARYPELAVILLETKRLDKIVNQIIDYARPRALVPVPFSLVDLVQEVLKLLDSPINTKLIAVTCDISPQLPLLHADRDQLKQVLLNVVQNSIEAVAAGGALTISAGTLPHDQEIDMVIKIKDNGCGIAADVLARVFEPFFTSGKSHGTGLGLAICRNIIEAHGGDILLTSDAGKGTLVQIILPLRQGPHMQRSQA
jgi:signal transduction histidine kinase/CHASE3 domain sensor protein